MGAPRPAIPGDLPGEALKFLGSGLHLPSPEPGPSAGPIATGPADTNRRGMKVSNYRKLIAAIVSVLTLYLQVRYQIDIGPINADVITILITILNPVAVWWFPNTKPA